MWSVVSVPPHPPLFRLVSRVSSAALCSLDSREKRIWRACSCPPCCEGGDFAMFTASSEAMGEGYAVVDEVPANVVHAFSLSCTVSERCLFYPVETPSSHTTVHKASPALRFCLVVLIFPVLRALRRRGQAHAILNAERERERERWSPNEVQVGVVTEETRTCAQRADISSAVEATGDRRRDWCPLSILCRYSDLYSKGGGCVRTTTILPPIHFSSFVRLFILPASLPPLLALWRSSLWMKEVHACRRKVAPATRTRVS